MAFLALGLATNIFSHYMFDITWHRHGSLRCVLYALSWGGLIHTDVAMC